MNRSFLVSGLRPRYRRSVYPVRNTHHAAVVAGGAVTLPRTVRAMRELAKRHNVPHHWRARLKSDLIALLTNYFLTLTHAKNLMSKTKLIPTEVLPDFDDAAEGKALTLEFKEATSGMLRVLKFGARFWSIREKLSARGQLSLQGRGNKSGLSEWLRQHAPEVNHSTAYRFLGVAEEIAKEYAAIVGNRVAKQFTLADLVTTPAADLPEDARAKQLSLFDYVSGTSQRSWLDRFTPPAGRGGDHGGAGKKGKPKSPAQLKAEMQNRCNLLGEALQAIATAQDYMVLNPADLDGLEDSLSGLLSAVRAWKKKPQSEKQAALDVA